MLEKLAEVESRYIELEDSMGDPEIAMDFVRVADLARERSSLQEICRRLSSVSAASGRT